MFLLESRGKFLSGGYFWLRYFCYIVFVQFIFDFREKVGG